MKSVKYHSIVIKMVFSKVGKNFILSSTFVIVNPTKKQILQLSNVLHTSGKHLFEHNIAINNIYKSESFLVNANTLCQLSIHDMSDELIKGLNPKVE